MKVNALPVIIEELSGRSLDTTLESYLPQYAVEMEATLNAVRMAAQKFPAELAPAPAFALKPQK